MLTGELQALRSVLDSRGGLVKQDEEQAVGDSLLTLQLKFNNELLKLQQQHERDVSRLQESYEQQVSQSLTVIDDTISSSLCSCLLFDHGNYFQREFVVIKSSRPHLCSSNKLSNPLRLKLLKSGTTLTISSPLRGKHIFRLCSSSSMSNNSPFFCY